MLKKLLCAVAALILLCAGTAFATQSDPLALPSATPEYDPASEEDNYTYLAGAEYDSWGNTIYAGASPIPLEPIDKPTPTPRPTLTFSYTKVQASNIGMSFEAPQGWVMDTTAFDTVVLTDPVLYDNVSASITIQVISVSSQYKLADVKTTIADWLKEIGQYNYNEWSTTELSARTLLKKDGFYANYRGVTTDGTVKRGRVMVALLDGNKIIKIHAQVPGWYNESYMNVLNHLRETLAVAQ